MTLKQTCLPTLRLVITSSSRFLGPQPREGRCHRGTISALLGAGSGLHRDAEHTQRALGALLLFWWMPVDGWDLTTIRG